MKKMKTRTLALFCLLALCVGVASAALITYVSTAMSATVTVTPQQGLAVGVVQGLEADPTATTGWQTSGNIDLTGTGFTAGDTAIITIMVNNSAGVPIATNLNMILGYADISGVGDPMNCDATGAYGGSSTCLVCGGALCIDGQEFDVFGLKIWNNALVKYDPELDNTFGLGGCVQHGLNAGDISNWGYNDGTECWWNYQDELEAGTSPSNPLTLSMPVTIQPGVQYMAVALKTKADPTANVQIAPGIYNFTVGTA